MASKHTSNSIRAHIYLYMFPKTSYAPSVVHTRSRFSCDILHLLLQTRYQLKALIFSQNVSKFTGGVHGHQAIASFLPQVPTVDHGALPWSTLNNAIAANLSISEPRACARQGRCPMCVLPGELTDLQRNSQPPVPSVSKCAHF